MTTAVEACSPHRPGVVVLRHSVIKEVPKCSLKSPPETTSHGVISIVHGSEKFHFVGDNKESTIASLETTVDDSSRSVTHIEIIRHKPTFKFKHGASRRVTGANRVVPLITSMWQQKRELKAVELSLATIYKDILEDPESSNEHRCESCCMQFLSATQVEHHFKNVHHQIVGV